MAEGLLKPQVVAAQQLIPISDEDDSISNGNGGGSSKRNTKGRNEQEVERTVIFSDRTLAKIQEIFGKDEVYRPTKKQRKYRSLAHIYKATAPIYEEGGFERKDNL